MNSLYCVEFPDDALAPHYPRGTRAFFKPASHADDFSVVVVRHDDQHLVRYLRRGRNGQEAAALDRSFAPLQDYQVEAVMCLVQQSRI
ncbi:S24 family peptidase [Roseateles sp. P5_E4]